MTTDQIIDHMIGLFQEHNINPAIASEAMIKLSALSAATAGLDNRKVAADLYDAVWRLAYAASH